MSWLILHIASAFLGLLTAAKIVPGVQFLSNSIPSLVVISLFLGLANFLIRPILKAITLPLRIITFGLFSLVINMFIVWVCADILFPRDYEIKGIIALFWTTIIVWAFNYIFSEIFGMWKKSRRKRENY